MSKAKSLESNPGPRRWSKTAGRAALAAALTVSTATVGHIKADSDNKSARIEALEQQLVEKDKHDRRLERVASIAAALTRSDTEAVLGENLVAVERLEGYGKKVSQEQRNSLEAATVKVVKRQKASTEPWQPNCTATKVRVDGNIYYATAAHCFMPDLTTMGKGGAVNEPEAVNITDATTHDYAIISIKGENNNQPIAYMDAVSMNIQGNDWALMRAPENIIGYADKMASLDLDTRILPTPGQEVALYSAPQANEHQAVSATGIYLGRIADPHQPNRHLDMVGLDNIDAPNLDACNYGSSGSMAIMAEGYVTGPLAVRNNTTYGLGKPRQAADDAAAGGRYRLEYEKALGIDSSRFTTVCGFSVAYTSTVPALVEGLQRPYAELLQGK